MGSYRFILATALAAAIALPANAALFRIDAEPQTASFGPFSLSFNDLDGDNLVSLDELLHFTGLNTSLPIPTIDRIFAVPDISGISDGSISNWVMGGSSSATSIPPSQFDHTLSPFVFAIKKGARGTIAASARIGFLEDFTFEFEDQNRDRLIEASEITGFSGFSLNIGGAQQDFDRIDGLPTIIGFTGPGPTSVNWAFGGPISSISQPSQQYTYSVQSQVVPLPPAAAGLAAALAGLAFLRRFRRA